MKQTGIYLVLLGVFQFFSCTGPTISGNSGSDQSVEIKRYGQALFSIDKSNLQQELEKLQPEYAFFLDGDLSDTFNLNSMRNYLNDSLLIMVASDCSKTYLNLDQTNRELTSAFANLKKHMPEFESPEVFTYISGFAHDKQVVYFDSVMIIALDMYLGPDYDFYKYLGLPFYRIKRTYPEYIVPDCLQTIVKGFINRDSTGRMLLEQALMYGKMLHFAKLLLPETPDSLIIGYTGQQMDWIANNEAQVWAFMLENELLYSGDRLKINKFIMDGPFTSYFSDDSPPRLAWWIGWKIIERYMEKNRSAELFEVLQKYDAQDILKESGYKPARKL